MTSAAKFSLVEPGVTGVNGRLGWLERHRDKLGRDEQSSGAEHGTLFSFKPLAITDKVLAVYC